MKRLLLPLLVAASAIVPAQRVRGGDGPPLTQTSAAPATGAIRPIVIDPVVTRHTINVGGRPLAYTANGFLLALPYLLTLALLAFQGRRTHAPAALGTPYEQESR